MHCLDPDKHPFPFLIASPWRAFKPAADTASLPTRLDQNNNNDDDDDDDDDNNNNNNNNNNNKVQFWYN